jgi:co-chaperonin GroES (HSP10)
MKHKPVGKYLLLKVKEEEQPKNIVIPEPYRKKQSIGRVLDTGNFVEHFKKGDLVYYKKGGSKLVDKEQGLVLAREDNIICDYEWLKKVVK